MISPGASSVPANSDPIITVEAPAASAFTTSPENFTPPSAITGTSARFATRAASSTAVNCGTPTPATIRVVQIEPGPTPTLTPDTPALISASVPSAVATLPPISESCGNSRRGSAAQPALAVFARIREALALLDVLDRDQAAQIPLLVHDQQLLDPVLVEQ